MLNYSDSPLFIRICACVVQVCVEVQFRSHKRSLSYLTIFCFTFSWKWLYVKLACWNGTMELENSFQAIFSSLTIAHCWRRRLHLLCPCHLQRFADAMLNGVWFLRRFCINHALHLQWEANWKAGKIWKFLYSTSLTITFQLLQIRLTRIRLGHCWFGEKSLSAVFKPN